MNEPFDLPFAIQNFVFGSLANDVVVALEPVLFGKSYKAAVMTRLDGSFVIDHCEQEVPGVENKMIRKDSKQFRLANSPLTWFL